MNLSKRRATKIAEIYNKEVSSKAYELKPIHVQFIANEEKESNHPVHQRVWQIIKEYGISNPIQRAPSADQASGQSPRTDSSDIGL